MWKLPMWFDTAWQCVIFHATICNFPSCMRDYMLSALCTQGSLELTGCIFVSLFLLTQHGTVYWIQTLIMWTRKAIPTVRILLIHSHRCKSSEWMEWDYCWYCCCMEDSLLVSDFQKHITVSNFTYLLFRWFPYKWWRNVLCIIK